MFFKFILAKIAENPDYFKSSLDQINATLNNLESGSETLSNIVKIFIHLWKERNLFKIDKFNQNFKNYKNEQEDSKDNLNSDNGN